MSTASNGPRTPRPARGADPYAPFRPKAGRYVALGSAIATLLLFVLIGLAVPGGNGGFDIIDRLLVAGCGVAIAALLVRYAAIIAIPDEHGIHVRNIVLKRDIPWSDIEQVQLRQGDPWPSLLLHDTDQVAVMAIQRADGIRSRAEVGRLVALVEHHHGETARFHPDFDLPVDGTTPPGDDPLV